MENLKSFDDIEVKLVGAISNPYETAVASARTCYSGKGIVYPEEVSKDEKAVLLRDKIASSTLEAGHLTTRQHAHFVFAISGVSRQFIWSFLHSHPFYNSEQVSQRYVKVKPTNFVVPPLEEGPKRIFQEAVVQQMKDYEDLISALQPSLSEDYYDRFKSRKKYKEKWDTSVNKRCFEVARYALGVGTSAYLYHTVSSLTLLRYAKLIQGFDTPVEQRIVISKMIDCVKSIDPLFEKDFSDEIPLEKTTEYSFLKNFNKVETNSSYFAKDFDLKLEGKTSKLANYTMNAEGLIADSLRVALGKTATELSDEQAIALLLDPKHNPILADHLNVAVQDRLSQILHHVHFTFYKKISHTADSQDQRHRTVTASRPVLKLHYTGKPDYITPYGVTQNSIATELYQASMERSFNAVNKLLNMGVKEEYAFYLLPNSFPIRMVSTGDMQAYHHKWKLRSCYNAQEEIFRATIDEISQVQAIYPKLGEHLRAPCYLRNRAGITPYCPEGDRYCGLPVWKYSINQYERKSL